MIALLVKFSFINSTDLFVTTKKQEEGFILLHIEFYLLWKN